MAYKFQLDSAIMSGSLLQVGAVQGATSISASTSVTGQTISADGAITGGSLVSTTTVSGATNALFGGTLAAGNSGFTVDADGDTVGKTLSATGLLSGSSLGIGNAAFTVSAAGAIAGATSIDASGDLTVGTITMAEFTVAANGNTDIDGTLNVEGIPTFQAGAVFSAGVTTANAIAGATTITGSGLLTMNDLSITQTSLLSGDIALSGAADTAVAVAADSVYFLDATTGKVRRDTFADLAIAMAGAGMSADAGVFSVQSNAVSGAQDGEPLAEGYNYFTGTVSATATLPASPSTGDVVTVKAGNTAAGEVITIQRAGSHLIDEDATSVLLESPYAAITFVYMKANDWRII